MARTRRTPTSHNRRTREQRTREQPDLYYTHIEPYLVDVRKWMSQGVTERTVQRSLGISGADWTRYKRLHQDLLTACEQGKAEQARKLDRAAYQSAIGHTTRISEDKLDRDGQIVHLKRTIYHPPDVRLFSLYRHNNTRDWDVTLRMPDDGAGGATQLDALNEAIRKSAEMLRIGKPVADAPVAATTEAAAND